MDFSEMFFTLNIFRLLSGLGLTGLLISPFFFPAILYGLPRLPDSATHPKKRENHHKTLHEKSAENRNSFEAEYLSLLAQKIDACMEERKPYLQHDFNLAYLSVMIQTPVHHLAYFFREVKNEHFNDYRNRWRVQYAKNLINEGKTSGLTLEGIGLNSGFSNRNAFRNAFKKLEGSSPADLASQIRE
jgi:YesN/AraC family two-component response regulator